MKIDYELIKSYVPNIPMFNERGTITKRVRTGLENVLNAYVDVAKKHASETDNNILNYQISNVLIVGSGARENKVDSDMDLMILAPNLDSATTECIRLVLEYIFFMDRPKKDAIDVFLRKEDKYTERESIDITSQVNKLIQTYNSKLGQFNFHPNNHNKKYKITGNNRQPIA